MIQEQFHMRKEKIMSAAKDARRYASRVAPVIPLMVTLALAGCGEGAYAGGPAPTPIPYYPTATPGEVVPTATSVPSETDVPTSGTQTTTPSLDTQLGPNQCTTVNNGDVIEGDVYINNQWTTDNVDYSGQITVIQATGTACAPYGADVQRGVTKEPDGGWSTVVNDAKEMQQNGCNNGCSTVLGNYWPNGKSFNPFNP